MGVRSEGVSSQPDRFTGTDPAGPAPAVDVQFRSVTKRFGDDVMAVDSVDLDVFQGEFLSLLGPSGCGKTTSLRMIAGFEQPTSGSIRIGGVDAVGVPPYRRDVNTVFQQYALFPHMTVLENVAYGLKQRRVSKGERQAQARDALELVQLTGREQRKPRELSGGQQQRVALARALVMKPRVLLLDEPLGALDLKLRKEMQIELKRLQTVVGITFIYVTHDQEEAMSMSDRIAVMCDGRIEQLDVPLAIYDRPASAFVADFIGDMNFLDGRVSEVSTGTATVDVGAGTVFARVDRVQASPGDSITVGVRPEKVTVTGQGQAGPNRLAGTLLTKMHLGDQIRLVLELPDGRHVVALEQRGEADTEVERLAVGDSALAVFGDTAPLLLDTTAPQGQREEA
jgi:spermidine/putrescine ABC transporter ATP-binding subunit